MTFTSRFVYMAHHFILIPLNVPGPRIDKDGWWFDHSVLSLPVGLRAEGDKNDSLHWLSSPRGWGSLTMTFSSCYGSIPLASRLVGRDGGLSALSHSCRFYFQQRVQKAFSGTGCLLYEDRIV